MPPQNHGGRPRTPSSPYNAQFDATYSPDGLQTSTAWGGGGSGRGGHGGGYGYESESSFDPAALMNLVYGYKQRGADADLARREKTEREERIRARDQANSLRLHTPQPVSQARQFYTNKMDLDKMMASDPWAGRGYGQTQGLNYTNMPAASALTYGQDIFPNGWDVYSNILKSADGVNPTLRRPETEP